MRGFIVITALSGTVLAGSYYDCISGAIEIERAIEIARAQVGTPYKAWISQSRRTGECFWKVRGTQGYMVIDARSGEIVKFYRNRR